MSTSVGFIYVLSNIAIPGVYKVGTTTNHPIERARQLSSSSSAAMPFNVIYYRQVYRPFEVEAAIHKTLDQYRINDSREFFKIEVHKIVSLIEQYDNAGDDIKTPFADLFESFEKREPGDPFESVLSPEEQRACRRLEAELRYQKAASIKGRLD